MTRRKGHPPVESKTPGPRKRELPPIEHIDTRVHVARSLVQSLATTQRCIWSKDGRMTNNRQWIEIERKHTKIEAVESITRGPFAQARIVTADGRRWIVEAREEL